MRKRLATICFLGLLLFGYQIRQYILEIRELEDASVLPYKIISRLTLGTPDRGTRGSLFLTCSELKDIRLVAQVKLPVATVRSGSIDTHTALLVDDGASSYKHGEYNLPPMTLISRGHFDLINSAPFNDASSSELVRGVLNLKSPKLALMGFFETGLYWQLATTSTEIQTFVSNCRNGMQ